MKPYIPRPIDTSNVELPSELTNLVERLAENTHENWAAQRMQDGWVWGPARDDVTKTHPGLVPYSELPESEKEYDRRTAEETLRLITKLGFTIEPTVYQP